MTSPTNFDLSSPEYVANPYPTYQRLLEEAPVYFCDERKFYYVSRYDYVKSVFRDPRASSNRIKPMADALPDPVKVFAEPLLSSLEKWVLFLDSPEHTKIRRVINPAFSNKVVSDLKPRIHSIAKQLLQDIKEGETVDLICEYAYPLPVLVIAEMLGCPAEERDLLKRWSDDIANFLGNKTTLESANSARTSIIEASEFFADVLSKQKQKGGDNLLQNLINFQGENKDFSDEHLIANAIALIFAGHETTTNLIANACFSAFSNDLNDQANPIWENVIEETLRFESPVQRMGRFAVDDIEIDGHVIKKGHRILLMLGAANRDPRVFSEPDVFLLDRDNSKHLAFGYGHHLCSGANVARTEAEIALSELFKHEPKFVSGFKPEWQYNLGLRALRALPVILG